MIRTTKALKLLALRGAGVPTIKPQFYTSHYLITNALSRKCQFGFAEKKEENEPLTDESFDPALHKIENPEMYDKDGNLKKDFKDDEENELEDDSSYMNDKKKSIYYFIIAAVGLLGGYFTMQVNSLREEKKTNKNVKVSYSGQASIGGPWKLYDMEGNVVTSKDFRGTYYLIYFGFCNCPDVCPQSLHKISKALELIRKMPESKYVKLKTLFVSVDPDRDTPERMRKFLGLFDSSIIGLTGKHNDDPDMRECMKKFKIYASKIELDDPNQKPGQKKPYTLDHTIITYLMSDDNTYLTHLGSNMSDRDLANTIIDKVLGYEKEKTTR